MIPARRRTGPPFSHGTAPLPGRRLAPRSPGLPAFPFPRSAAAESGSLRRVCGGASRRAAGTAGLAEPPFPRWARRPHPPRPIRWSCPRPRTPGSPQERGAGRATRPVTAIPRFGKRISRWPGGSGRSGEEAVPGGRGCCAAGIHRRNRGRRATAGSTSPPASGGRCARWRRAGCRSPAGSRGGGWCPSGSAARDSLRCGRRTSRCGPPCARASGCGQASASARSCAARTVRPPACTGDCCGASATWTRSPCCPPRSWADPPGCCRSAGCRYRARTAHRSGANRRTAERTGCRRLPRPAETARRQDSAPRLSHWARCGRTGG